jgi:hypothetical protein
VTLWTDVLVGYSTGHVTIETSTTVTYNQRTEHSVNSEISAKSDQIANSGKTSILKHNNNNISYNSILPDMFPQLQTGLSPGNNNRQYKVMRINHIALCTNPEAD